MEKKQKENIAELKNSRNNLKVSECLNSINETASANNNLMPVLLNAAHNNVTLGEMVDELKKIFGTYTEANVF